MQKHTFQVGLGYFQADELQIQLIERSDHAGEHGLRVAALHFQKRASLPVKRGAGYRAQRLTQSLCPVVNAQPNESVQPLQECFETVASNKLAVIDNADSRAE